MSDTPRIGFIGLGLMGSAMVGRLQDKGYPMTVLGHRDRTGVEAALARGATEAASGKALAEACDVVMLCVATSASVEDRMMGDDGVIAGLSPGQTVIDFGTSEPASTRMLAERVAEAGAVMLDAPLGRTPAHAKDGLLNIMAAGDQAAFGAMRPVLDDLGENVFHVGPSGAGHTLKLINNFYGMTTLCAMAEAFAIGDLAGIPRETLFEVMGAGPLRSGMMEFVKGWAVDGEIHLAFSIANGRKDVGYYTRMADDMGVPSQMSGAAKNTLALANAEGWGGRNVPEITDWFAELFAGKS